MERQGTSSSLVGRLVVCIACFGVFASVALAVLSFHQTQRAYRAELSSRIESAGGTLRDVVRGMLDTDPEALQHLLEVFAGDAHLRAVKVWDTHTEPVLAPLSAGRWLRADEPQPMIWTLDGHAVLPGLVLDPQQVTQVRVPFDVDGHELMLEMLVDGPAQHRAIVRDTAWRMLPSWAVLAVATLLASIALRLWVLRPLNEVVSLIEDEAGGKDFARIAESRSGEHSELARALAERLSAAEQTDREARGREEALSQLFEFAPAALLEVDAEGTVRQANARALRMFGGPDQPLIGQPLRRRIDPADRPTLRQVFERLQTDATARCDLRLRQADGLIEASLEAQATYDASGDVVMVRLALTDRTRLARLHRRLAQQACLLELTLNHLDEAVVLVDASGRVSAHNRPLENLLQQNRDQLQHAAYDHARFWSALGWVDVEQAVAILERIERDDVGMAHATIDTRHGLMRFRGVRVRDDARDTVGRLWIVGPASEAPFVSHPQDASRVFVLHGLSRALAKARDTDALMAATTAELRGVLGTDAVGVAVRSSDPVRRCRILMDRSKPSLLVEPHALWSEAIAAELMPDVLAGDTVRYWAQSPADARWADALAALGLQSLAAAPLVGARDELGVLWAADLPGRSMSAEQLAALQAAADLVVPRLEQLEQSERFCEYGVLDPETLLTTSIQFERHAARATLRQPDRPWVAAVFRVENFTAVMDALGPAGRKRWVEGFGDRLRARCRRSCVLSRLNESSFAVWAPDLTAAYAEGFAQRLRAALCDVEARGCPAPVISAGLGCFPADGQDSAAVLAAAARRAEQAHRLGDALVAWDTAAPDRAAS